MNFYRIFLMSIISLLLASCIDEDYKLWGAEKSGNYSYRDIKAENAGTKLLTVIFANQTRIDQSTVEVYVISGLSKRYESDETNRKVKFTTNPIDATTSTTKLVIQFDIAKNASPQKLCSATGPNPFGAVEEGNPIKMTFVYCKNDKARAWIRAESLNSSKVEGELIELMTLNSLNRMTSPNFANENNKN